ncbi:MAG: restriction endonuclease, partial [Chloroflexota bacterium]
QQEIVTYYEDIIKSMRSELNYWVGHVAEAFIRTVMRKHFKNQTVDGAKYFNHSDDILLSQFERVYPTKVQTYGSVQSYQIDVYAMPKDNTHLPWAVEIKNWQTPVSQTEVRYFWEAARDLADEHGHAEMVCWLHARSGFTEPARKFMQEKGILHTDAKLLTTILEDFQVIERWREP